MKKSITLFLAVVLALTMLTACGSNSGDKAAGNVSGENTGSETPDVTEDAANEDSEAEEKAPAEVTITHSKGTTVIPAGVSKAAVFDYGILDIIDSLGIETELAVPVSDLPEYLSKYAQSVNAGGIKEPDLEAIFSFEPDVIFISGRQGDYYDQLSEIAPTVYVDLEAANYMEDFKKNVLNVADIFSKQEDAAAKLAAIDNKTEEVKAKADASETKALIVLTNDGSISAYGKGSRFGLIHDVLSVKIADENIEVSTHGQEASYEYIADINPDILYVVDRTVVVGGTNTASGTLDNDLVNGTNAAKNNKIVMLSPDYWYLSGGGLTSVSAMIDEIAVSLD